MSSAPAERQAKHAGLIDPPEAHYWTRWRGGARSQAARFGAKAGPG
jgi:hypothetical protein